MEYRVASVAELGERGALVVKAGDREIGVFRVGGHLYAYENRCAHQGGPVCKGDVLGRLEEVVGGDGTITDRYYSEERLDITCPWHGWEYDLRSGEHIGDPRYKLRPFPVYEDGDDIVVSVDGR